MPKAWCARNERLFGKFSRAFKIKTPVKVDAIDATYKDGMLTLTLPKAEEAKPKAIKIS
ncbi:MAG: Hsp20/alpha crystallin family protein [Calditrichia bacterium]